MQINLRILNEFRALKDLGYSDKQARVMARDADFILRLKAWGFSDQECLQLNSNLKDKTKNSVCQGNHTIESFLKNFRFSLTTHLGMCVTKKMLDSRVPTGGKNSG
jgi:hypothetical protein